MFNLSGNLELDKVNNFNYFRNNPKVESISIRKIKFNKASFNNFLRVISANRNQLKIIELNNILLSKKYLLLFLISL